MLCGILDDLDKAKLGSAYELDLVDVSQQKIRSAGWEDFIREIQSTNSVFTINNDFTISIKSILKTNSLFGYPISQKYVVFEIKYINKKLTLIRATGHVLGP